MSKNKKYADYAIRIEPSEVYDHAIVGMSKDKVLIYSHERIIQILMGYEKMDEDEAHEWADFNIYNIIDQDCPQFRVTYARKYRWKLPFTIKNVNKGVRHQL
jgi:hypothetical protein